jgi:hypothetical protein
MSLYIEPELKAKATALALAQSRSLNNFINLLIQQAVDQAEATGIAQKSSLCKEPGHIQTSQYRRHVRSPAQ